MSVDIAGLSTLPCSEEASYPGDSSTAYGPEEEMSTPKKLRKDPGKTASPQPSSEDLAKQDSPDSSTGPRPAKLATPGTEDAESPRKNEASKDLIKKQKVRTVFSPTQLRMLHERFQKQKYLSLQQMQELSSILNLTYKQVKTWFQNQRMKYKRWQKSNWPMTFDCKGSASTEIPGLHSNYPQGFLNPSGSLPMWSNPTWNNPTWSSQTWNNPAWNNYSCNGQAWYTQACNSQAWNTQLHNFGEESLQPYMQCQQNLSVSDLGASLEATGESHKYFSSSQQALDLFLNYSVNSLPGEV